MIGLVLSMVRARPGQALTAFVLAMLAMAAAVSAPVYTATADRAVVASEVAAAPIGEKVVRARREARTGDRSFEELVPKVFTIPGFTSVFSTETNVMVSRPTPEANDIVPRLVYRDNVCEHLRIVTGRCYVSPSEVLLGKAAFDQLKIGIGAPLSTGYATFNAKDQEWKLAGPPVTLTVVGVYEPVDASDQFWSDSEYFDPRPSARMVTGPMFGSRLTIENLEHQFETQGLDVVIGDGAITGERLQAVDAAVKDGSRRLEGLPGGQAVRTDLPQLIARVQQNRGLVGQVVPVAAVPLVLLCWFVLFVAVASATADRRLELGLLSLRGTTAPRRWWLAAGESVVPILFGAGFGFLLGHYLVRLSALLLLSTSSDVPLSAGANRWALAALVGALLAALLAQRPELAKRTVDLLRNVPSRVTRWAAPIFEVTIAVLAVVALVQLRRGGNGLAGFAVLAPSLIIIAVGLITARGVLPLAERRGRAALRRGRLGTTLAAYGLARRPGSQRILALFVVAIALACFSATAAAGSGAARDERIRVELGADRVLSVEPVSRTELLGKVHAIDPTGDFAMATAMMPAPDDTGAPSVIAVDTQALPNVALWNDTAITAADARRLLRPDAARPSTILDNKDVTLDITVDKVTDAFRVRFTLVVVPLDGSAAGRVDFGLVQTGRHQYVRNLPMCEQKCRLVSLQIDQPEGRGFDATVELHSMSQRGNQVTDFANPDEWRVPDTPGPRLLVPTVTRADSGLRLEVANYKGADVAYRLLPADVPTPLPVILGGAAGSRDHITGFDSGQVRVNVAGTVPNVPRLAAKGGLIDLDYADRMATDGGDALYPQIWLNPRAPADILQKVRDHGLTVTRDERLTPLRAALEEQGPAVALRFHELAGGFAVVLAAGALWLVATLDRVRRRGELQALRAQGVGRREASANSYLALVGAAAVIGPFAALASWLLVREYLPVFTDDPGGFAVPALPPPLPVAAAWLASGALLTGVALLAGARLRAAAKLR